MKMLTYTLVAGSMFWLGVVLTESRQPIQPAVIVPVYKTPRMFLECSKHMEIERDRACRARVKSAKIGGKT